MHTIRARPFEASVVFQAKRSPLSYCRTMEMFFLFLQASPKDEVMIR